MLAGQRLSSAASGRARSHPIMDATTSASRRWAPAAGSAGRAGSPPRAHHAAGRNTRRSPPAACARCRWAGRRSPSYGSRRRKPPRKRRLAGRRRGTSPAPAADGLSCSCRAIYIWPLRFPPKSERQIRPAPLGAGVYPGFEVQPSSRPSVRVHRLGGTLVSAG